MKSTIINSFIYAFASYIVILHWFVKLDFTTESMQKLGEALFEMNEKINRNKF